LPIGEAICGDHWAVLLVRLPEHHKVVPLVSMDYGETIKQLAIHSDLLLEFFSLGNNDYADALGPKVIHRLPYSINDVLTWFAKVFTVTQSDILCINYSPAEVALNQFPSSVICYLLGSPSIVVSVLWIKVCAKGNAICRRDSRYG